MNFKVLCCRGSAAYLVQREGDYCLVDLLAGNFRANENPGVFLKMGYFEDVDQADPQVVERIARIIGDPANQARL